MCSQIAVAVAVDGLPTHAATDLFNLSQLNRSSLIVTTSPLMVVTIRSKIAHQISENSEYQKIQIAHQISENSDQPQQRPASCGGGCGCWSPYTGNLVEVAVGNCGCDWRSLSWMGPLTYSQIRCCYLPPRNSLHRHQNNNWRFTMTWEAGWRYGIISTVPYE